MPQPALHPPGGGGQLLSRPAYLLTAEETARELTTDPDNGLTEQAASERLQQYGLNELQGGGGVSVVRILMGQIFNAMVLVRWCSRVSRCLRLVIPSPRLHRS